MKCYGGKQKPLQKEKSSKDLFITNDEVNPEKINENSPEKINEKHFVLRNHRTSPIHKLTKYDRKKEDIRLSKMVNRPYIVYLM